MPETMRAAQLVEPNRPLEIVRVPVPSPGYGELLLKLDTCGVCHTDIHIAHGDALPPDAPRPLTLGHEGIGQVVECGPETIAPVGARLGAPWLHACCEQCRCCLAGWESYCPQQRAHGYNVNGAFAEYVIVKEQYAAVIPDSLDSLSAAPLMCAGVTAYSAVTKAEPGPGKTALIIGCGGLGQYAIQLAKHFGANVIAVDVSDSKLEQAIGLGADEAVLANGSAVDAIRAFGGADAIINFAPTNAIWPLATGVVNNLGTIVSVAMVPEPVPLSLEWLTFNGVRITGTSVGTRDQMRELLSLVEKRPITIDIESIGLAGINDAMERLEAGQVRGRLVIELARNA